MADGQAPIETTTETEAEAKPTGLALLRAPFPENCISKLPKPTAAQTKAVKDDYKQGIRCEICGQWHHPKVVHLDYVGHAALTDRLLDCDPAWNWKPVSMEGLPHPEGGMWIELTVCGVSRLGYGSADGKKGGDAIKEIIGDALRNAAMRFGAALDLWHKGDLHPDPEEPEKKPEQQPGQSTQTGTKGNSRELYKRLQDGISNCASRAELVRFGEEFASDFKKLPEDWYRQIKTEYAQELEAHIAAETPPEHEGR